MNKKMISILNPTLTPTLSSSRLIKSLQEFILFANTTPLKTCGIYTMEEMLKNLTSTDLDLKITKKNIWDLPKELQTESIGAEQAHLSRLLLNKFLSQKDKLTLFQAKLKPFEAQLKSFIETVNPAYKNKPLKLINIEDLSSTRFQKQFVYALTFKVGKKPVKIIIKQCSRVFQNYNSASYEQFMSEYLKRCGLPSIHASKPIQNQLNQLVFEEYKPSQSTSVLFENSKLLPKYQPIFQDLIRQFAAYAAAFDIIGKGDRYIGLNDKSHIYGNYLIDAQHKIWAIDHEFALDPYCFNFLRADSKIGSLESAILISHEPQNLSKNWDLFKKAYLEQIEKIRSNKDAITNLIKTTFPNSSKEKLIPKNLGMDYNKWLEEVWNGLLISQENLPKTNEIREEKISPDGHLETTTKIHYPNGQLQSERHWKNNQENGMTTLYFPNGKIKAEFHYKDNLLHGDCKIYYPNGHLKTIINWDNGLQEGPEKNYNAKGHLIKEQTWKQGKEDGLAKTYYPNGKLKKTDSWNNGILDGLFQRFYPSGQLKIEYHMKNWKAHGLQRTYDPNGFIIKETLWENNKKISSKQFIPKTKKTSIQKTSPTKHPATINPKQKEKFWATINANKYKIILDSLKEIKGTPNAKTKETIQKADTFISGDIHGALGPFVQNLWMMGLINQEGHWIGKTKKLIQTGDIVDFDEYSLECYTYLKQLQKEAQKAGGDVILLLGNHEFYYLTQQIPNLKDIFEIKPRLTITKNEKQRIISPKEVAFFKEELLKDIMNQRIKLIEYLPEKNLFCSHAGLHPKVEEAIRKEIDPQEPNKVTYAQITNRINQFMMNQIKKCLENESAITKEEWQSFIHHPLIDYKTSREGLGILGLGNIHFLDEMKSQSIQKTPYQMVGHTTTQSFGKKGHVFIHQNYIFNDVGINKDFGSHQAVVAWIKDKAYEIKNPSPAYADNILMPIHQDTWQTNSL